MYIFQGEEREGMAEEIKVVAVADPAKQVHTYAGLGKLSTSIM